MHRDYKKNKDAYPELATFFQLGLVPNKETAKKSGQLECDCVFCGKESKFYIDSKTKKWDCKSCGLIGGFKTFVDKISEVHKKAMNKKMLSRLASIKSLPLSAVKPYYFGYDSVNDHYVLYVKNSNKEIINARLITKNGKALNISGFSLAILGLEKIDKSSTIWLTEGEWDKFALDDILQDKELDSHCVVCIPGANTFKQEWIKYFKGKKVNVCYDNDKAGKVGCIKVHNALISVAKEIKFIHWPENKKEGYDVRDFYISLENKPSSRLRKLKKLLNDLPLEVEGTKLSESQSTLDTYDGTFVEPKDIISVYTKWLYMPDTTIIDILYGTIIANRFEGQPLWLFLVGASGTGKTEIVESLSYAPNAVSESHVTSKSLISGAHGPGGSDPSLIPKLHEKMLFIKDFTVTINSNPLEVEETFGILRDIYDGRIERSYGNGVERKYHSKFGIIAAVTPIIDKFTKHNTSLGERFLKSRIKTPDTAKERLDYIERALENADKQEVMKKELAEIAKKSLSYAYDKQATVPSKIKKKIMALSQFLAMARASVIRDTYHRDRITHKPFQELGTRLSQQFSKFVRGIATFRGKSEVDDNEFVIAKQLGLDSIPDQIESVISFACSNDIDDIFYLMDVQKILMISPVECEYVLSDMVAINILELETIHDKTSRGIKLHKNAWCLTKDAKYLIEEGDLYDV